MIDGLIQSAPFLPFVIFITNFYNKKSLKSKLQGRTYYAVVPPCVCTNPHGNGLMKCRLYIFLHFCAVTGASRRGLYKNYNQPRSSKTIFSKAVGISFHLMRLSFAPNPAYSSFHRFFEIFLTIFILFFITILSVVYSQFLPLSRV